jgi:hypothetical protein
VSMAREVWTRAYEFAERHPLLSEEWIKPHKDNNNPHWKIGTGSVYRPAASTRKGARSLSVDRLVTDEVREMHDWIAYNASVPTMNARPRAQGFFISNQGDDQAVVLNALRKTGIANIEALEAGESEVDEELALFEWSAPPGAEMTDPIALCQANPNANVRGADGLYRVSLKSLVAQAHGIKNSGDREAVVKFQTEILCQRVSALDGAIDPGAWEECTEVGQLAEHRSLLALVPELSPDQLSASINIAAVQPDGRVRGEVVASWSGLLAEKELRRALPGWIRKIKPRKVGWIPGAGAAAIGAELEASKFPGTEIQAIRGDAPSVCMGFAALVHSKDFVHSGQERLTKQALPAAKLWHGDTWVFSRKGDGHCDSLYGVAAAAHLARTIKPAANSFRLITSK